VTTWNVNEVNAKSRLGDRSAEIHGDGCIIQSSDSCARNVLRSPTAMGLTGQGSYKDCDVPGRRAVHRMRTRG
jgi:hypothetical protein